VSRAGNGFAIGFVQKKVLSVSRGSGMRDAAFQRSRKFVGWL
jgi:hypothetical protein